MKKQAPADPALVALVDELGDLEAELSPFKAKFARLEIVRAAVRARLASANPAAPLSAAGARWRVILGPAKNLTSVNRQKLYKLIGWAKFVERAAFTVKALEGLPSDVQAAVLTQTPTGARAITVVAANGAAGVNAA